MAIIDTLVNVSIQDAAAPVSAESTSVPLLIANSDPSWTDGDVVRAYGTVAEMAADGFDDTTDTYKFATLLMSAATRPSYFLVGKKAGAALAATDLDGFVSADNRFYGIIPVKATDAEIETLADWTEGEDKLAWVASSDTGNGDPDATGTVAAYLKGKSYKRTALLFSPGSAALGISAAWAGSVLPQVPGSINPAYRTLPGVSADNLSTGQVLATVGNLVEAEPGNRANVYISQYSNGVTLAGTTGASTIYEVMGIDWLKFNMRAAVFSVLAGQKRALTDKDVNTFIAAVRGVLAQAVTNGLVDPAPGLDDDGNALPGITVTAPSVRSLTAAQRAAGRCPTIQFTCTFAGPINAVAIKGTLVG